MEKSLNELCHLCNSMNGLQQEISDMEDCLLHWDKKLKDSLEQMMKTHCVMNIYHPKGQYSKSQPI
ncbi:hypothetical protein SAMN05216584_102210 [Selenomonas sp. WCT3]|uniref:hypothetical protein n=1 Tax=Selenomonas sp. WCT3 TaxID=3158785 RepID=UPI000886DBFA|nr:hypothetical protein SAMN05216584_102210 [Selenomonas ruminantium]